jgi:hypothetical protein
MRLRYLRVAAFTSLMRPFAAQTRKKRMVSFSTVMKLRSGTTILDLGGQPMIWDNIREQLNLTILNRPGIAASSHASHHKIRYIDGDACAVEGFAAQSFDIVFSNSVIEHVGSACKQAEFAREARRLGCSYWVQTPSKWFPIEAHCGMPFWWFYPAAFRRYKIERWRKKLPEWTEMVEQTSVLTKRNLQQLFPEATIVVETCLGLPKSYVAYFVGTKSAGTIEADARQDPAVFFQQREQRL